MHAIDTPEHPGESVHLFVKTEQKLTICGGWLLQKFGGEGCLDAFAEVQQTKSPSGFSDVQVFVERIRRLSSSKLTDRRSTFLERRVARTANSVDPLSEELFPCRQCIRDMQK